MLASSQQAQKEYGYASFAHRQFAKSGKSFGRPWRVVALCGVPPLTKCWPCYTA